MVIMPSNVYLITSFQQICKLKQSDIVVVGIGSVLYKYYRAIKLICNRVIHGFESVCLLRLSFKKRHTVSDSWTTRLQINLIALYFFFIGPT
jgi:hypothetical protein